MVLLISSILLFAGCAGKDDVNVAQNNPTTTVTNSGQLQETTLIDPSTSDTTITAADMPGQEIRVEVYHFHATQQCVSCKAVGSLAEKTVNTYFKKELDSGKIVFGHINGELPENAELVKKYGATGSSLWIGTYVNGKFTKEENVNVWYKINNEPDYLTYLKGVLDNRLKGDLT